MSLFTFQYERCQSTLFLPLFFFAPYKAGSRISWSQTTKTLPMDSLRTPATNHITYTKAHSGWKQQSEIPISRPWGRWTESAEKQHYSTSYKETVLENTPSSSCMISSSSRTGSKHTESPCFSNFSCEQSLSKKNLLTPTEADNSQCYAFPYWETILN